MDLSVLLWRYCPLEVESLSNIPRHMTHDKTCSQIVWKNFLAHVRIIRRILDPLPINHIDFFFLGGSLLIFSRSAI